MHRSIHETFQHTRHDPTSRAGHYESFYQRANHPTRPLAFWIRTTIFAPAGRPEDAVGELWAIFFDGETNRHVAVRSEVPLGDCEFATDRLQARVGTSTLDPGRLVGRSASGGHEIVWDLRYEGEERPVFLLPLDRYEATLPRAKALVGVPRARYAGRLEVDGTSHEIDAWPGTQNHNWGSRHTDHYAYGQVTGFDGHPESHVDVATGRIRLGPFWTPWMTPLVLRHRGREHACVSILSTLRAKASFDFFDWRFTTGDDEVTIEGRISAPTEAFVGLAYPNPPGGLKHCLNTKIAACELRLTDRRSGAVERLNAPNRALFEIMPPDLDAPHGIPIVAGFGIGSTPP